MKKYIPNIITCSNLVCGCLATAMALYGDAKLALIWMIIGAAFDFCDGLSARLLGVSSPIGKELDSLADCVTFGVAPASILFFQLIGMDCPGVPESVAEYLPFFAYIIAAFSALRLAKFNLDTRQTTSFIGLPTPANALFWGSLIVGAHTWFENQQWGMVMLLVMAVISSWLLVCELPMFALKFKHWGLTYEGNLVKYGFILFSATVFLFSAFSGDQNTAIGSIAIIILAYILVSFIMWCTNARK